MNQVPFAALNRFAHLECPVVAMPHGAELPAMEQSGRRLIVGADGFYKEVRRPWLHAIVQIGQTKTPYGFVKPKVRIAQTLPRALLDEFLVYAKQAAPMEVAAWLIWNEQTNAMRLHRLNEISVSRVHVKFDRPQLAAHEHIFLDVHSHHTMSPEFSAIDDADDLANAGTYIAGVVGHIDKTPTWNFRLCLDGEPFQFLLSNLEIGAIT